MNRADYHLLSDSELLVLLKTSDPAAFNEIYSRFFGILYVFVLKRLRDEDIAKDVVQDLFSHIWIKRESLEFSGVLPAYLYTAVRNKMLDFIRSHKVYQHHLAALGEFVEKENPVLTDHLIREKQLTAIIEKEVDALPKRMQEIFVLSRQHHKSYNEIAQELNLSQQTVKTYAKHAIKILRGKLGPQIPEKKTSPRPA